MNNKSTFEGYVKPLPSILPSLIGGGPLCRQGDRRGRLYGIRHTKQGTVEYRLAGGRWSTVAPELCLQDAQTRWRVVYVIGLSNPGWASTSGVKLLGRPWSGLTDAEAAMQLARVMDKAGLLVESP